MSAGKATRESTPSILAAAETQRLLTRMPILMGSSMSTRFCPMRLPTGRCPSTAPSATSHVVAFMMSGIVNSVMMLLRAVNDTERATSPLASMEKMFDELPPGQQAMSTTPMKNSGSRSNSTAQQMAISGKRIICPMSPANTGHGRWRNSLKSFTSRVRPSSNMSRVRMGNTIQIVFMTSCTDKKC